MYAGVVKKVLGENDDLLATIPEVLGMFYISLD